MEERVDNQGEREEEGKGEDRGQNRRNNQGKKGEMHVYVFTQNHL